jgi:catalase
MSDVNPPARDSDSKPPATTSDSGIPAPSDEYSLTVGPTGPTALHDHDPDSHRRDLRTAIDHGDCPEWRLETRIMPFTDAADYRFNPCDLTKIWPQANYPPIHVGRRVLDRNPANFFAEVVLMGRIFSYHDTHLHRIGPNDEQLPINARKVAVHSYTKDASITYDHAGAQPVHAPNSHRGPQADPQRGADLGWSVDAGELGRYAYEKHAEDDDFVQPGRLYREVMSDTDREHIVTNIVGHATTRSANKPSYA